MWRAGVRQVGVHFGTWPWLCDDELQAGCEGSSAAIAKYDALLAALEARQLPLRVMLPIAPSSRLPTTGWEDYVLDVTTMVARVLARYGAQISQVGMHEPSSVEKLILQAVNPTAVLDPTQWRMQLVDPVCTLVHGSGATCSASLIPGPFDNPQAEARFIDAAILSNADWLGVNNIQFYGLDPAVVQATEDFVLRFADGDLVGEEQGPARGLAHVFINAAWRPAWPMAAGRPLESNAAGTGCMELTAVDLSYLGALFAWARSMRLHSVNVFYTTSFVAQTNCDRDLRIYTSVHSSLQPGVLWPWYQIGNPISDGDYRLRIAQQLALPVPPLTAVGERHRLLSGIARSGSDLHADGFE